MVFTRSITTLKLSTSIGIDLGTYRSKVCDFILYIYSFYGILIIFNTCLSIAIDLETLWQICMHPMQFGAWEQSNSGFPTTGIRALG